MSRGRAKALQRWSVMDAVNLRIDQLGRQLRFLAVMRASTMCKFLKVDFFLYMDYAQLICAASPINFTGPVKEGFAFP